MQSSIRASVLLAVATAPVLAQQNDDGAVAPANRWYTEGGCAARTRQSLGWPVRDSVAEAWRCELDGEITGGPLVWDDRVVVSLLRADGRRSVNTLSLATGNERVDPIVFRSESALQPTLWRDTLLLRTQPSKLQAFQFERRRIASVWHYEAESPVGSALLFGSEIYAVVGRSLQRLAVGRFKPLWSVDGQFRGTPSLRGDSVYAIEYDSDGNASVVRMRRESGAVVSRTHVGHHKGEIPDFDEDASIAVMDHELIVRLPRPVPLDGGQGSHTLGLTFPPPDGSPSGYSSLWLTSLPAGFAGGSLARMNDRDRGAVWFLSQRPEDPTAQPSELLILASKDHHAELLGEDATPAVVGGVAYVGPRAIDLSTLRILWNTKEIAPRAVIPARDTALLFEAPSTVIALRSTLSDADADDLAIEAAATTDAAGELPDAVAVFSDGSIEQGRFEVRVESDRILRRSAGRGSWKLSDLQLLVGEDGTVLRASGQTALVDSLERVADWRLGAAYADLARRAAKTYDVELVERLLSEARLRGVDPARLSATEKALEKLKRKPKEAKADRVEAIEDEERSAQSLPAEELWKCTSRLWDDAPALLRTELLRRVLARDAEHAEARQSVRALLPPGLEVPEPFDALDWLRFAEAIQVRPVSVVAAPQEDRSGLSHVERELGKATVRWRKDLVGFHSEQLLIMTPLSRPGAIARCLSLGELVCEALDEIFGPGKDRDERFPLRLELYASQEEYLEQSRGGGESNAGLSWTAGHYSHDDNVSRIFLPDGDEAWESVLETYAHELTHHWIRMRCPLFSFDEARGRDVRQPGYWIVEGFASLIEESLFDPSRRSWRIENPRSRRLDLVANSGKEALVAWDQLFGMSYVDFRSMEPSGTTLIDSTWFLGKRRRVDARSQFYNQAASVCRFLFLANDGAHRASLLNYVKAYYTGESAALDPQTAFGMSSSELGRLTLDFARAAQGG